MIEQIGTAPMEVALLGAFTLVLGAFALILWDLLRGRRRGWSRVVAVVVGAPACALAATVISAGIGWAVAVTLEPGEQPPARTEQTTPESRERSSPGEGRGPERTTERSSASPTAIATAIAHAFGFARAIATAIGFAQGYGLIFALAIVVRVVRQCDWTSNTNNLSPWEAPALLPALIHPTDREERFSEVRIASGCCGRASYVEYRRYVAQRT